MEPEAANIEETDETKVPLVRSFSPQAWGQDLAFEEKQKPYTTYVWMICSYRCHFTEH